ncbi:MAG: saccharopine dehydrogenase NADP-binding domain-containing protein [Myxococcales bacterium]|nr:saccharopine dehydrogenase NADP-binding domain-containing protein [Myxococcales bacterium]
MKKVTVLGAGLVGGPMAADLAADFDVTLVDRSPAALAAAAPGARVTRVEADLSGAAEVRRVSEGADVVLSAVPGFMGYRTLATLVELGKPIVDIAFFGENPLDLDGAAKKSGAVAVVDMGIAPGLGSILAMHGTKRLDETRSIVTYVAGLPLVRRWPYEYAAVFSPVDVIEEYVRPARYVERGELVTRPALSDPEYIDFPLVGTLEAFNTDGLRTMAQTMRVPNMKEKTMRYPGHIEKMALLRESGFFSGDPIDVGGVTVRPVDVTAKLLFPMWKLEPGAEDVTVLRVVVEGTKDGRDVTITWDLLDRYDAATGVHSMARTTGYTATAAVRLFAAGKYTKAGVSAPEHLGQDADIVAFFERELAARGVRYQERVAVR